MKKIVLGITGASGSVYASKLIKILNSPSLGLDELALVFTSTAKEVWMHEIGSLPQSDGIMKIYDNQSFFAPFASGSGGYDAMLIAPCSMGTMGRIAHGISMDLIGRAADVMLKERKPLLLLIRESPFHLIHIRNMELITLAGGIIMPASPSFYHQPQSIDDLINDLVCRALSLVGIETPRFRWMG